MYNRVTSNTPVRQWTPEQEATLLDMYNSGASWKEIAEKLECSIASAEARADKLGVIRRQAGGVQPTPIPDDFTENAKVMTRTQLCQHYNVTPRTVWKWIYRLDADYIDRKTYGIPADFSERAKEMTKAELGRHYIKDGSTIQRWLAALNITAKKYEHPNAGRRNKIVEERVKRSQPEVKDWRHKVFTNQMRSEAAAAAHFLRRHYGSVFRCDIKMWESKPGTWGDARGLFDHGRNQYFVSGKGTMWLDELIELARSHGFTGSQDI